MNVLDTIVAQKRSEVARTKARLPQEALHELLVHAPKVRQFRSRLEAAVGPAIIAEVKRASPSKGVLLPDQSPLDFRPVDIAKAYEENGAQALSVLTNSPYFWGADDVLAQCRAATTLPVLRKDFIVDPYQVLYSRWLGADAILLLARCLTQKQLIEFSELAYSENMDVLIEIHHQSELTKALAVDRAIIGINHRDLTTLEMHPQRALELKPQIPENRLVIGESGIKSYEDIRQLQAGGIQAFLVGSHLVASGQPGQALAALLAVNPR